MINEVGRRLRIALVFLILLVSAAGSESGVPRPCTDGKSGDYSCNKVTLQAHVPFSSFSTKPGAASNIWGYVDLDDNREYAIIGFGNSTGIVDVTNPVNPRVVGAVPAPRSRWREVKVHSFLNKKTKKWDAYAYITTEAPNAGLQILDLSKLPQSVSLARVDREINTAHTAFVSNVDFATGAALPGLTPYLYLEGVDQSFANSTQTPSLAPTGCGNDACGKDFPGSHCTCGSACSCSRNRGIAGFKVFSLANPKDPKIIGTYTETYMHDVYIETFKGGRANQCAPGHDPCEVVFGWTGQDFRIIDFTQKSAPVVLSALSYEKIGYPHSGWISKNKQWLFNFDELDEYRSGLRTRILSIDITDFRTPKIGAIWDGTTNAIEHNGYVVGEKLYVSSYARGLLILDVKNPMALKEIGYFDTYPEHDLPEFRGAWGVYPYLPSGNILISDMNRGLFILKEQK